MSKNKTTLCIWFMASALIWAGCATSKKVVATKPEKVVYNPEAMGHMINGAIEDLLGQTKNALVSFHQAAEIDTSSPGIFLAIAENYFYLEEYSTSIRMAKRVLRLDPANIDAFELLAANYEKQRQYQQAMLAYKSIVKIKPYDLESLYNLTSLQIILRNYEAMQTFDNMVESGLDDPEYRLRIGHLFLKNKATSYAEKIYLDISKSNPNYEPAFMALAATSKANKDTTAAIEWYRRALLQNSGFEDCKAELRVLLEKQNRWSVAVDIFEDLVQRDSTNLTDKLQLGQYYFLNQDTTKALNWFSQIIAQHPRSERGWLALGAVNQLRKKTSVAQETYRDALQENPGFLEVRNRLKDLYVSEKRWQDAIDLYESLKDNDSTFVGSRIEIANLLAQKGDTLQAIASAEELFKSHAEDWRVALTIGRLYFISGKNVKAAQFLDKAVELRQDLPGLWVLRGVNYLQIDSLSRAESNFEKAAELHPKDSEIAYYLGYTYSKTQKIEKALATLHQALALDPKNIQAMLSLSALLDESHQYDKSEPLYQTMLELRPNMPIVLNNYAYHLSVRNVRLEDALEMVKTAILEEPDNSAYLDTMGWIHYQLGQFDRAKILIEKSLKIRANSAEVLEHMGDVYEKLGDLKLAQHYWIQALELAPGKKELQSKLARMIP